ncbi:NUDIX domain-containing protein [Clostridium cellulovorans]|uniref:NUDIX hydrolase n=1 Tax=Clostridium cellulovorans (strain ATCC 35296 / DSM 3052 / OCM 3 / 743B) TaxID=573061 RepID=D9SQS7_CLOC7|nr:NUDIX hydrolase [Clostridium cellulovorans]ADL52283.1 NUDIX hydrolase [Clostridium cellulovorans 743B]
MVNEENTDWGKSVAGIVIKESKVLLVRHTYGAGKGKLIIPGGYMKLNETPTDAVKREILEETGVTVEPLEVVGIRFNFKDWYVIFTAKYIGGEAQSDGDENSEAVWIDINEAVTRADVPDLTQKLLISVIDNNGKGFKDIPYDGSEKNGPFSLYGLK